jgi:hypothetical protein
MNQQAHILTYGQMREKKCPSCAWDSADGDRHPDFRRLVNFSCPAGKGPTGQGRVPGEYKDGDPAGRIEYPDARRHRLAVAAEVFVRIGMVLHESPYRGMMVTVTNGAYNTGYIPNDSAYAYYTLRSSSRLAGCV